jgi:FkbM family methyltransferase
VSRECRWQAWGGHFYSQHGEDIIVLNIFNRMWIDRPSYLDIGAHHPFNISNTALLYDRGCRGINVEPNPQLIEQFHVDRPDDINLCMGAGARASTLPLYCCHGEASGKSSFVKELAEATGPVTVVNVPVCSVAEIVRDHAGGIFPDFLSVDAEGLDLDVLRGIDYGASSPKVICVEMFSADNAAIKDFLHGGYFMLMQVGANGIFVRRDFSSRIY